MKRLANMTPEEIAALTREQLLERIRELEPPPPSDWHSWMDALLHIVLHRYPVTIEREFLLGSQPPRADFLILMEQEIVDLGLEIFRIFREHNIIEFKAPDDELNESVLWKCIGYAGFYMSIKRLSPGQVTLTLIRDAKPRRFFEEMKDYIHAEKGKQGIYQIQNWQVPFPIQVIVTSELTGPEYAGFRSISKKPSVEDVELMLRKHKQEVDPELIGYYRAYWNVSVRLTGSALEEAKRRTSEMANDVLEFFKTEVELIVQERVDKATAAAEKAAKKAAEKAAEKAEEKAAEKAAVAAAAGETMGRQHAYYEMVQDGDLALDRAAKKIGMTPAAFIASMAEAGYTVPQTAAPA